jgi:hypothetical protein
LSERFALGCNLVRDGPFTDRDTHGHASIVPEGLRDQSV